MGNTALLARAAGHEVLGADTNVYPPMSTVLAAAGIVFHQGYDAARLAQLAPDLVVIGNAMSRGNVEVEWLLETRVLGFTSLPAFLAEFILKGAEKYRDSGHARKDDHDGPHSLFATRKWARSRFFNWGSAGGSARGESPRHDR